MSCWQQSIILFTFHDKFVNPFKLRAKPIKAHQYYIKRRWKSTYRSKYYYLIGEHDYTSTSQIPSLSENLLVGVPAETFIYGQQKGYMCYGLYSGEFRKYSNDDFLSYNKTYLRLPKSAAGAKTLSITIDETPAGISEVNDSKKQDAPYYTLSGTRLSSKPTHPGIVTIHFRPPFL